MSVLTRKFTLYPQGDTEEVNRVYNYIRNGQEVQAQMMNLCVSALWKMQQEGISRKDEAYKATEARFKRVPNEKKKEESAYYGLIDIEKYPKGISVAGNIVNMVRAKLDKAFKDGLKYGCVSVPSFRKSAPLYVQKDLVYPMGIPKVCKNKDGETYIKEIKSGIMHSYESNEELFKALEKEKNPKIYIKFANKIVFDFCLDNLHKTSDLRDVLMKIFSGQYQVCDSGIGVYDTKIYLFLSVKIPDRATELDKNKTVGVDLGVCVPAVCALNNDLYKREYIGSFNELIAFKMKKKEMRRRLQEQLKNAKGGHGRKKKLARLEKYDKYTSNYAKTYNHKISKQIVEFALKNNAAYINLEHLSGVKNTKKDKDIKNKEDKQLKALLSHWSVYDLQKDIEYKAKKVGIKVRYINPAFTSQTCSICGQRGERPDQKTFICTNPDCNMDKIYDKKKMGKSMQNHFADFNAARNIAMSTDFVKNKKNNGEEEEEASE